MLNRGSWVAIVLMLFLLTVTAWYAATLSRIVPFLNQDGMTNLFVLNQGSMIQMNAAGAVEYHASVNEATQQGNGEIDFSALKVVNNPNGGVPWTLTAPTGVSRNQNHQIELNGGVILSRPPTGKNPALQINTDHATLYPGDHIVQGDDLITFKSIGMGTTIDAIGFKANTEAETIHLLSHVHSEYDAVALPIQLKSHVADVDVKQGVAIYSGQVVATQGHRKLEGNTLTATMKDGHIHRLEATGSPAKTEELPEGQGGMVYGEADTIQYYPSQQLVKYKNSAILQQNGKVFKGDEITYDNKTETVASPETAAGAQQNTQIILPAYSSGLRQGGLHE